MTPNIKYTHLFFSYLIKKKIFVALSTPFLLFFATSSSEAQTPNFGEAPSLTNISPTPPNANKFDLKTGVACPVPTFTISSFFGRATNNQNPIILPDTGLNESTNSNLNNFGVAAGLNVPLGGRLGKACKDRYAAEAKAFEIENQIGTTKFQSELVQECYYLYSLHINFDQPAFNKDGPVSGLFPCRAIVKSIDPPPAPVSSTLEPSTPTPPKVEQKIEDALKLERKSKITSPELPSTQQNQPFIIFDDRQ